MPTFDWAVSREDTVNRKVHEVCTGRNISVITECGSGYAGPDEAITTYD